MCCNSRENNFLNNFKIMKRDTAKNPIHARKKFKS